MLFNKFANKIGVKNTSLSLSLFIRNELRHMKLNVGLYWHVAIPLESNLIKNSGENIKRKPRARIDSCL